MTGSKDAVPVPPPAPAPDSEAMVRTATARIQQFANVLNGDGIHLYAFAIVVGNGDRLVHLGSADLSAPSGVRQKAVGFLREAAAQTGKMVDGFGLNLPQA